MSQIAPTDWSALLAHADAIGFFEPTSAGPSDCIYYLAITSGG